MKKIIAYVKKKKETTLKTRHCTFLLFGNVNILLNSLLASTMLKHVAADQLITCLLNEQLD